MSAILDSLNVHNFLIFQPILMILVSKFMVYRPFSDKTYLLLGLRSPLKKCDILHIFALKQSSWVHVRTASVRRIQRVTMHDLCY